MRTEPGRHIFAARSSTTEWPSRRRWELSSLVRAGVGAMTANVGFVCAARGVRAGQARRSLERVSAWDSKRMWMMRVGTVEQFSSPAVQVDVQGLKSARKPLVLLYLSPTTIDFLLVSERIARGFLRGSAGHRYVEVIESVVLDGVVVEPRTVACLPLGSTDHAEFSGASAKASASARIPHTEEKMGFGRGSFRTMSYDCSPP